MTTYLYYGWVHGFGLSIEHLDLHGGFSIILTIAFLRLHFVFIDRTK